MKIIQEIKENWIVKEEHGKKEWKTTIPSSIYSTLLEYKEIEDPYWRDNEDKVLELSNYNYEYIVDIIPEKKILEKEQVYLEFEGIDTIADIYWNGECLGHTENMHRQWQFDVTNKIKKEKNQLKVILYSPTQFIKEEYEKLPYDGALECMKGYPHLRKAHCMFGWDWGIHLPDMGIFRPVSLVGYEKTYIEDVQIHQVHTKNEVDLCFDIKTNNQNDTCYQVEIISPDGSIQVEKHSPKQIKIKAPKLWWPNGYGQQPLYKVRVQLFEEGKIVDEWEKKIGLRTITVDTSEDEYGNAFTYVVNGQKIFAMGANYIPEDSILSRISKERTKKLLMDCKESHFNIIRVWGGGYYPDDFFYDICDELGLLVWQDFMFACAVYPMNETFEENVRQEIIQNVRRIRHHACLALWCGNNEMEMYISQGAWIRNAKQKSDYLYLFEYMIPKILKIEDNDTFYWRSSPSSEGGYNDPNRYEQGDTHYWEVWHSGVPFTEYRKYYFRYLSEFGFQSFPSLQTIKKFTLPNDRNIFSYVMEKHQRNGAANGKILNYLSQTYLYPNDFEVLLYASQLLQAEAIKYGVEHFRRNRGRCMGTIYWQLNDCWPTASWSSIDYFGNWKALQYYAKRFFAPILLSCEEEGCLTQGMDINVEGYKIEKKATFTITNETGTEQELEVRWTLRNSDSTIVEEGTFLTIVQAYSCWTSETLEFELAKLRKQYVFFELWKEGECISSSSVLFCPPKHFLFEDPQLKLTVQGKQIQIEAKKFAKNVEIYSETEQIKFSDNFFDMNTGIKWIEILEGEAKNLKVRSVYDIK